MPFPILRCRGTDSYPQTHMDLAIHADVLSPIPDFWQVNDPKRPSWKRRDATLK